MWLRRDAWLRLIQPLVANVPMLATIGERFITPPQIISAARDMLRVQRKTCYEGKLCMLPMHPISGNCDTPSNMLRSNWLSYVSLIAASAAYTCEVGLFAGNHDVEQQHILSKYLASYQARFKVIICPSSESPDSSSAAS